MKVSLNVETLRKAKKSAKNIKPDVIAGSPLPYKNFIKK